MDHSNDKNYKADKKPFSFREWFFALSYDRKIFWLGMLIAFLCLVAWIAYPFFPGLFGSGDCRFKEVTGFYCPGCGGTRAVRAFLNGHLIKSFIYHPFVPYCFFMWILYEGSHILEMLHVPRVKGMKFRSGYAYAGVIILFANFVIKNILLYVINHR